MCIFTSKHSTYFHAFRGVPDGKILEKKNVPDISRVMRKRIKILKILFRLLLRNKNTSMIFHENRSTNNRQTRPAARKASIYRYTRIK